MTKDFDHIMTRIHNKIKLIMGKNKSTLENQFFALKNNEISPDSFMLRIIDEWERIEKEIGRYIRFVLKKYQYLGKNQLIEDNLEKTALLLALKELIQNDHIIIAKH